MISLIFFSFLSSLCLAENIDLKLKGEADFYFEYNHSPTSKTGQTAFEISRLEILPSFDFYNAQDQLKLELRFDLAEKRDNTSSYQTKMENAYLSWQPSRTPQWTHELGLIRPLWRTEEARISLFDNFGDSSKNLSRRYQFLNDSDMGYQGIYQWKEQHKFSFAFVNGEENRTAEVGASKEIQLGYFHNFEDILWSGWLSFGRVDQVEDSVSEKSRILLRHQNQWGRIGLGLEFLYAADSNSDFESSGRAEGMTFTELTEPRNIRTDAYRVELYYTLNPLQQILVRYDSLRVNLSNKGLTSVTAAWLKSEPELFDWGLYYESTLYGSEHSAKSRQIELVRVGLSKVF